MVLARYGTRSLPYSPVTAPSPLSIFKIIFLDKELLQLNLYKFILEEMGHKVNKMYIVCFHPSNLSYKKIEVSKLDVKTILNKYSLM